MYYCTDMSGAEQLFNPFISTMDDCSEQPDVMDAVRGAFLEYVRTRKVSNAREAQRRTFETIYLHVGYPLAFADQRMPALKFGSKKNEEVCFDSSPYFLNISFFHSFSTA